MLILAAVSQPLQRRKCDAGLPVLTSKPFGEKDLFTGLQLQETAHFLERLKPSGEFTFSCFLAKMFDGIYSAKLSNEGVSIMYVLFLFSFKAGC